MSVDCGSEWVCTHKVRGRDKERGMLKSLNLSGCKADSFTWIKHDCFTVYFGMYSEILRRCLCHKRRKRSSSVFISACHYIIIRAVFVNVLFGLKCL